VSGCRFDFDLERLLTVEGGSIAATILLAESLVDSAARFDPLV
jgi:hypothetical protein